MVGLSACVTLNDPEASQEYSSETVGVLNSQTNLGQSFISRRSNLNGITIWLSSSSGDNNINDSGFRNSINIKLFHAFGEPSPIFTTSINAPVSGIISPVTIKIPSQKNPGGENYYIQLTKESESTQINGRNEDAYPLGQAYINENPVNADIAFRLSYDYDLLAFFQDIKNVFSSTWIIAPLLVILWMPGWLLLDFSGLRSRFDFGEQIAISIGLSLALVPVFMLWTTILKINWSRQSVVFTAGFLVAILITRLISGYISSKRNIIKINSSPALDRTIPPRKIISSINYKSLALILIFLASLAVRLIMVRDLATPAWVDSVHHALITRIIMNAGGYPSTYLPYWDTSSTAYHSGFHSIAATFTWLTNLDLAQSLLILGQVLNALCVFSVYLFTTSLTRSSSAGLLAAIITGFLTPMPAYYTSWGRYTELTGLLILPVVLGLIQLWMDGSTNKKNGWIISLGAIAAGGLFMIHYRVIVFLVGLAFSFVVYHILFRREFIQIKPGRLLLFVFLMAVIGILLVIPWFFQTFTSTFLPKLSASVTASVSFFQDFSWPYLTSTFGKQAMVVAALGLLWSFIKRRSVAFIISLWILMLFFLANMDALKLPGGGLITNTSVEIMLFIPISCLGGYFIDQILVNWKPLIPKQLSIPYFTILFFIFGFVSYLGAKQIVAIINPITILSREADMPAIEWVNEHIPEDETIVINPFAWGYGLYAGNDGGYWISPLSDRLTLPPPVLYGLGSGYEKINQQCQEIVSSCTDPIEFWKYLNSQKLHYVFIGAKGGVIPPGELANSGLFTVLYHQNGVWILVVKPCC